MPNKSYTVIIQIDFNTIDCPGVWLCPKGKAFLKICLFGIADLTKDVDPFFPMVIRERFIFEKEFRDVSSVYDLHDKIGRSIISVELLQCPVGSPACMKLAIFNSLLSDLLHPYSSCFARPPDTSGIELLFTTCKIFPGIIAPKADVALKVVVTDTHGDGCRPTVRRMPLKIRKGDNKRQQAVCHSKNGLNCGCFSRQRAQPREYNPPHSGESGDRVISEPRTFSDRAAPRRPSTDHGPQTSQFHPKPPNRLSPHFEEHQGPYHFANELVEPSLQSKEKSHLTRKGPKYEEEPDMEWAKLNLGVALGPGEYKGDQKEDNTLFSAGWEYLWDGPKSDKKNKRQTILSARRQFRTLEAEKKGDPMKERGDEYGDEAIRREMEECDKLLKDYKSDDMRDEPELKLKYDNCVNNMEWLRKHHGKAHSSDKIVTSTSPEGHLQATNDRRGPVDVPCHGKCCKCKEEQMLTGPSIEHEGQTLKSHKTQFRNNLSPIDENAQWIPREKWEKEHQREVRRRNERVWEREVVIHKQDRGSRPAQEIDSSDEPRWDGQVEQEQRKRERERRRQEEAIRQRKAHEEYERKNRMHRESSSEPEPVESSDSSPLDEINTRGRASEAPRKEPLRAERRVYSPERVPKRSSEASKPTRPLPMPYNGRRQEPQLPLPSTKRSPTPQQPKSSDTKKPAKIQQRSKSPVRNIIPDGDDSSVEDCECDLCEQYQELYNPSSHPCPRFRNNTKKKNLQTLPKNTGPGAKKLITSRKNAQGRSRIGTSKKNQRNQDHQNAQCVLSTCDGPIDSETIDEEMNAITKFYYGK